MSRKEELTEDNSILSSLKEEVEESKRSKFEKKFKESIMNYKFIENPIIHQTFTTGLAMIMTHTLFAPIERMKTILQTNTIAKIQKTAKPTSVVGVFVTIANDQGAMQFFRGNLVNMYKYALHAFVRTFLYERFKYELSTDGMSQKSSFIKNIWVNSLISLTVLTTGYPFDLVHTRMAADMTKRGHTKLYSSVGDCFKKSNTDGVIASIKSDSLSIKSLYRGYSLAVAGTLPYTALSLPLYDFISSQVSKGLTEFEQENFYVKAMSRFLPSTLVLLLLSGVLYPLETGKKLLQVNGALGHERAFGSAFDSLRKTKMLYRGYTLHILKLIPFTFVQFSLYELCKALTHSNI